MLRASTIIWVRIRTRTPKNKMWTVLLGMMTLIRLTTNSGGSGQICNMLDCGRTGEELQSKKLNTGTIELSIQWHGRNGYLTREEGINLIRPLNELSTRFYSSPSYFVSRSSFAVIGRIKKVPRCLLRFSTISADEDHTWTLHTNS